jgi:chromosome segregation ATPase
MEKMKKSDGLINSLKIAVTMLLVFIALACGDSTSDSEATSNKNINKLTKMKDSTSGKIVLEKSKESIELVMKNLAETKDSILNFETAKAQVEDSLNYYTSKLTEIGIQVDEIAKKKNYVSETNEKAKSKATTNINDLESNINSMKISKSDQENELKLIEKRKLSTTKKNEALKSELDYKESELKELYSQQNAQQKIKEVNLEILEINKKINNNNNLLLEEELNEKLLQNKIKDLTVEISKSQNNFKTEYEKNTGLNDYVKEESAALDKQIKILEDSKISFTQKWKTFRDKKETIDTKLEYFNSELGKFSTESNQQNDFTTTKTVDTVNNTVVNSTKENISDNNKNLQKFDQEITEETETSSTFIYWLLLVVVLALIGLYWVGKKNKKS